MRVFHPAWVVAAMAALFGSTSANQGVGNAIDQAARPLSSTRPVISPLSFVSVSDTVAGAADTASSSYGKAPTTSSRSKKQRHAPYDYRRRLLDKQRSATGSPSATTESPNDRVSESEVNSEERKKMIDEVRMDILTVDSVVVVLALAGAAVMYFTKWRHYDRLAGQEDPLQYLHGLRREDMEDIALEALKWQCAICYFHNPDDRECCGLCDTKRGTELALVDMNTKQKCARARKQWQRRVDPVDGEIYWHQAVKPAHFGPHYVALPARSNSNSPASNDSSNLLHLAPLTDHSGAGVAITGDVLPSWWLPHLHNLTAQNFSLKYAWLLTQIAHSYVNYAKMQVYRDKIFDESLEILMLLRPDHLCAMTRIELLGESGIDAGGVLREWYSLLTLSLFEPERGLFVPANQAEQSYFINPSSAVDHGPDHLRRFQAIGRMLGSAIVDGQVLPFHLSLPLFKVLLGAPLAFEDVWHVDLNTYNSLVYIRQTDHVDDLALDFSVTLDKSHDVVDLVPNGRNIPVTIDNRDEYVERMVSYLLFDRIQPQLSALVRGLYEVVPAELLMPFDHKELELLVCGYSHIDVADWKASTSVSLALKSSNCIKWFWDVVEHELTDNDRAKLLRFATGSSRVPLQGFKGLTSYDGKLCPFSLKAVPYSRGVFPKAHSCFNRIDLPIYPTRELLKEALLALVNLEMAEFTLE